ncbi:hypothetical protein DC3_12250 [Deinococcus cellulosilyticus NBRC 106333 = KACC 11606]|uniref:Uncharacterized protein n=1 Tax=Deinococcus cellulosilyticus (strain DSM 18568 / NBRC 106333 / KACC 11606 / 5516J-15) TaxID=1223518 RepID=A0A511MYB7_DEIC1|nr:hypothetical protein DC3_12250 [Deinococcus cellulosilyticus NBRC 106333 = KACC 11606]
MASRGSFQGVIPGAQWQFTTGHRGFLLAVLIKVDWTSDVNDFPRTIAQSFSESGKGLFSLHVYHVKLCFPGWSMMMGPAQRSVAPNDKHESQIADNGFF